MEDAVGSQIHSDSAGHRATQEDQRQYA